MSKEGNRETFSSGLGVFFATLSSAVGLGNIWKFPYLVGENGGGTFLLIYLLCVLLVGIPLMISEFYIGRKTRSNVIGAVSKLKPNTSWRNIGYAGIMGSYFIIFYYTTVAGWVYSYVFKSIKGDFNNLTLNSANNIFTSSISNTIEPILWQILVIALVSIILILGVQKGIEKVAKTLMPVLFILILLCCIRSLTLPGASQGIKFLFHVDFSKVTADSILVALGLAFFKLGVGSGSMVTYGSYFTDDNNMIATSAKVAVSDTLVSVLAGLAIFPAVFSFNMEPTAGRGLLFMSIPLVFSKIFMGKILLTIFFILTAIASTTAIMSIFQVLIAYYTEEKNISLKKAVIFNAIIVSIIGSLATLSSSNLGLLYNFKIFGKTFFDIFDTMSSNILLPLGGLLTAIFVGYVNKKQDIVKELSNNGNLKNQKIINIYYFILKTITPVLLVIIFLNSLGIIKF
ncbi:sodium-dependent transporter [Clostridium niameyense]|uniref:sodium-dependent transporter n=1 Tax=Clostridium niameyense TaxID=1622073 RepID=UPI00067F6D37|nr:sodium-dependent transporter [Clostridium niameyense]